MYTETHPEGRFPLLENTRGSRQARTAIQKNAKLRHDNLHQYLYYDRYYAGEYRLLKIFRYVYYYNFIFVIGSSGSKPEHVNNGIIYIWLTNWVDQYNIRL